MPTIWCGHGLAATLGIARSVINMNSDTIHMNLNLLSPRLQEWLLFLPEAVTGRDQITLRSLRLVCQLADWNSQEDLLGKID